MKTDEHIETQIPDISGNNTAHCYSTTPQAAKITLSRQLLRMGTRWPETSRATYKGEITSSWFLIQH